MGVSTSSIELFAYPWDILDRGPEAFVEDCCNLGVNRVHATTLYHSGKFLLPRNRKTRVYFPESGSLYVDVDHGKFANGIKPATSAIAASGWWKELSKAAGNSGVGLAAWTVFHHSSTLAAKHPELAIRNLFGDTYPFALCPSHQEVRGYSVALAAAIQSTEAFDTLDLETIGFLGFAHGYHHEVTAVPLGALETFLLSLCFCPACCAAAEQDGIAVDPLREYLQRLLLTKLNADDSAARHPDNLEQLLTLVATFPPLQHYIQRRLNTVTDLVRRIRSAIAGMRLGVFTSSFVGSPSNVWMEGVSLLDLQPTTDVFHLLAYSANSDEVNSDLLFCLNQVDPSRLNLTINLGLPITPTLDHAMAKIDFAWNRGVRQFSFFNHGLLGEARLQWVKEISEEIRHKKPAT